MPLNARQLQAYRHYVTIIRPERVTVVTGKPQAASYTVVATGVQCHLVLTQNDSDTFPVGRIKRRSALTEDEGHFALDVDIQGGDLVYDTTPGSVTAGQWGTVMGDPKKIIGSEIRTTNKQTVQMMQEEKPPAGALALV